MWPIGLGKKSYTDSLDEQFSASDSSSACTLHVPQWLAPPASKGVIAARAGTPLADGGLMFTRAQLSPVPGTGKRCDSAPCSSLASRGPSRGSPSGATGPSPSPLGGNIWREDAKWPVREGGLCSLPGTNGSLDLDLDLARRLETCE
eukprot:s242_g24.t1